MMRRALLLPALAASALLGACSTNDGLTRLEPTYEEAAASPFLNANRSAINRMVGEFDRRNYGGDSPVLVATIVNVNDLSRAAPLGRTLSEQFASQLVANGFQVKELKLRGDVFVKEGTGELLLSREIKDIARNHRAALVLVGTYSPAATMTFISLKLVRTEDSQIVRSQDYALPNDRDVARLLQAPR